MILYKKVFLDCKCILVTKAFMLVVAKLQFLERNRMEVDFDMFVEEILVL